MTINDIKVALLNDPAWIQQLEGRLRTLKNDGLRALFEAEDHCTMEQWNAGMWQNQTQAMRLLGYTKIGQLDAAVSMGSVFLRFNVQKRVVECRIRGATPEDNKAIISKILDDGHGAIGHDIVRFLAGRQEMTPQIAESLGVIKLEKTPSLRKFFVRKS